MTPPLEKGMMFSSPMIRALENGSKTMTRRLMKPQPKQYEGGISFTNFDVGMWASLSLEGDHEFLKCPHPVGSRIYAKETFYDSSKESKRHPVTYRADTSIDEDLSRDFKWKPSIFMPKKFARIWMEVVKVRVERLGDISEEDAKAEGVSDCDIKGHDDCFYGDIGFRCSFEQTWNSIHGPGSWNCDKELWTWVYEFRRIKR